MFSLQKFFKRTKHENFSNEIWFYRKYDSTTFVQTSENLLDKKILLVDSSNPQKKCFCPDHLKWEKIITEDEKQIKTENCTFTLGLEAGCALIFDYTIHERLPQDFYPKFYREFRGSRLYNDFENDKISLEELNPVQFRKVLHEHRKKLAYEEKQIKISDMDMKQSKVREKSHAFHKDLLFFRITFDETNQILRYEQYAANRPMLEKEFPYIDHKITEFPFLYASEEYDIKNGTHNLISNQGKHCSFNSNCVRSIYYPNEVYEYCEALVKTQLSILINKKINFINFEIPEAPLYSSFYYEEKNFNQTSPLGEKLKAFITFPYEPALYFALSYDKSEESRLDELEEMYRFDSNIYSKYCKNLGVPSFPSLKKLFLKDQSVLLSFRELLRLNFKDINIICFILKTPYLYHFLHQNHDNLKFFLDWAIPLKGEKNAWNLITKGFDYDTEKPEYRASYELIDALSMFQDYFLELDYDVRTSILKDGFTKYNHDLLSNYSRKLKTTNVDFSYTENELMLQDEINGYTFDLPKDYYELMDVASQLHNCAASYRQRILKKQTLVMYAKKDGKYVLCIEVRGMVVHQERADRNATPKGEDAVVMQEWRNKHHLHFDGNHY